MSPVRAGFALKRIHPKGFTLIELMIVVAIVAILSSLTVAAFLGISKNSREAKRASDANTVKKAVEQYYAYNGSYPLVLPTPGQAFTDSLGNALLKSIPTDPDSSLYYYYAPFPSGCSGTSGNPCTSYVFNTNSTTVAPPPVGWWKMDEASWNGTPGEVKDTSGNAFNGTSVGGLTTTAHTGYGNAGSFDGINDYISIAHNALLEMTSEMTFSAWINPSDDTIRVIAKKLYCNNAPTGGGWRVVRYSGGLQFSYLSGGLNTNINITLNSPANQWTYITLVKSGSTLKSYANATLVSTVTVPAPMQTYTYALGIGQEDFNCGVPNYFSGLMDDVRIYNYARSADQITQDMSGTF